jgi:copper(I)-binding protein
MIRSLAILTAAAALAAADPALVVEQPWSRATAPTAKVGAGFMTLVNPGGAPVRVVAATAPVSATVELHTVALTDGVMRMRQVDTIEVPAGGRTELKPGSFHLMFIGLHRPLAAGDTIPLVLTLADGATLAVPVPVQAAGSTAPAPR